jgi:hypothetical protein
MRAPGEIWRQRLWVWVPALVFFLANATAYTVYRFGFADRVAALQEDLKDERERLEPLQASEKKLRGLLERSRQNEIQIERLYAESFSTREQRLTKSQDEVKSLARKAGLDPKSLSYPTQQIQQYGLVKRSFIFSVEGTYIELRRFINLLELSDSFLTLEQVTLSQGSGSQPAQRGRGGAVVQPASEGSELRINLTLSTIFANDPNAPNAPGASSPVAALRRGR